MSSSDKFCLPLGMLHFKIQKEGFVAKEIVTKVFHEDDFSKKIKAIIDAGHWDPFTFTFSLYKEDPKRQGMIRVDGKSIFVPALTGLPFIPMKLDAFFVDRTEVTNKAYKEFMDAGGILLIPKPFLMPQPEK